MTGLIDWLTAQLAANPFAVAAVVALLAVAETVIVVGTFVPGIKIVLAIAAAAGAAGEGLWVVFLATAAGTIAGDLASYWARANARAYPLSVQGLETHVPRPRSPVSLLSCGSAERSVVRRSAGGELHALDLPTGRGGAIGWRSRAGARSRAAPACSTPRAAGSRAGAR